MTLSYQDFPKLEAKREKLMKTLEERSYEGDRTDRDYIMEEPQKINYPKIEIDENGALPEDKFKE